MFKSSKPVPWRNWDEWKDTYRMLYSNNIKEIQWGCNRVFAWGAKQLLPVAIEVTASLLKRLHSPERDPESLSMAIIRFINGVVEPFKNTNLSVPISTIGASYGVPEFVITIRHSATHGKMPTFEFAALGAKSALEWLHRNYWEAQLNEINSIEQELDDQLMAFILTGSRNFEGNYPMIIMSFGIDRLVKLVLNKNQKKRSSEAFQQKILELLLTLNQKKDFRTFISSFILRLAEETAKGDQIASSWLSFFHQKLKPSQFPFQRVSLILQWANPSLLGAALPLDLISSSLESINSENADNCSMTFDDMHLTLEPPTIWPPTSIGNLPTSSSCLTIADDEYSFVEPGDDDDDVYEEIPQNISKETRNDQPKVPSNEITPEEKILEIW